MTAKLQKLLREALTEAEGLSEPGLIPKRIKQALAQIKVVRGEAPPFERLIDEFAKSEHVDDKLQFNMQDLYDFLEDYGVELSSLETWHLLLPLGVTRSEPGRYSLPHRDRA